MITTSHHTPRETKPHARRLVLAVVVVITMVSAAAQDLRAASVRVWATAVVVNDDIHLSDVCELRGFGSELELALRQTNVMPAPQPGASLKVHQSVIRDALRAGGANLAQVTVSGAVRCEVTRPAHHVPEGSTPKPKKPVGLRSRSPIGSGTMSQDTADRATPKVTLQAAVVDFMNKELQRYRGRADVTFDRSARPMLELSSPQYTFRVHRSGASLLGLVAVEVDVISQGSVVQVVPLVVQVSMARDVVVARRSINQGATIGIGDIETTELRFGRVEQIGLLDAAQIVGQRAKRFISSGSMIELSDVESVPIIVRGQLITLVSVAGGVQVVTTAKAAEDGLFGDTIKVRAADNRRVEFDAVVIGAGRARVGTARNTEHGKDRLVEAGS